MTRAVLIVAALAGLAVAAFGITHLGLAAVPGRLPLSRGTA